MILYVFVYLVVFAISTFMAYIFQKMHRNVRIRGFSVGGKYAGGILYCTFGCIFLLPIIAMFGLRYGIGTDYFNYENIYNALHSVNFVQYWKGLTLGRTYFYVEPGYYLLNRVFPNYRYLLWGIGILIFALFWLSVKNFKNRIKYGFALFIFLCVQYIFSQNVMRYSIALGFILLAYEALTEEKNVKFFILVLLAALFHKTSLCCIAMFFLKEYKNKEVNRLRNILLFGCILLFPFISNFLFHFVGNLSIFQRYFSTTQYYKAEIINIGWKWLLHIAPVILPLILFCRKEIFDKGDTSVLFRICIMEIPFRMLGLYNTWYTRLARYPQIAQVIFIPLVIEKIENRKKRRLLYLYYFIWYTIYSVYYAIVNDQCDSLPYVWIFSR